MRAPIRTALILSALALMALAGCDQTGFLNEAGSEVDEGNFGNPTLMNGQAMTGEINASQALGNRFASDVTTTVNFAFNSSTLSAEAIPVLKRQANWIKQFPEVRFSVYGHTDLVGSEAYNKGLGLRRAQAVVSYLASQGISTSRLQALVSYGKTQPVVNTPGPEVRNRRAVTSVSGFSKGYAGKLNGKYAAIIFRDYVDSATRIHPSSTAVSTGVTPSGSGNGG